MSAYKFVLRLIFISSLLAFISFFRVTNSKVAGSDESYKLELKFLGVKAKWIKACIVSNKRSGVQTMWLHAWTCLNNLNTV